MASAPSALRGACQHGANAAVLIGGPAGIGKTILLAEICRRVARMSIWVGWSKCDPIEQVCRFLLRSLVSRLAGLPVVWMFASRDAPVGIDLVGHDSVGLQHIQLAPLATIAEPNRLGSSHRRARRRKA